LSGRVAITSTKMNEHENAEQAGAFEIQSITPSYNLSLLKQTAVSKKS